MWEILEGMDDSMYLDSAQRMENVGGRPGLGQFSGIARCCSCLVSIRLGWLLTWRPPLPGCGLTPPPYPAIPAYWLQAEMSPCVQVYWLLPCALGHPSSQAGSCG